MKKNHAFSLFELSITLVIIALLTSAIVTGKHLIKRIELTSVISEVMELKTAIAGFKLSYGMYPGDLDDAYDYWGVSAGCTDTTANTAIDSATTTETGCNGNGNNLIEWDSGEFYRSWQHLSLAKVIPGTYTGKKQSTTSPYCVIGTNCPTSSFHPLSNFMITTTQIYLATRGMHLFFSTSNSSGTDNHPNKPVISPQDANSIDHKIDDGKPATGKIETLNGWDINGTQETGCTSINGTNIADTATYIKSDNTELCIMAFFLNDE